MRNFLLLCMAALCCLACNDSKIVTVTVTNPLAMDRSDEMVEVSMTEISNLLNLADTAQIVVLNVEGEQVPYQVTYDDKLIFPATVAANASAAYTVQAGTPVDVEVRACGRQYPERLDDMAWENDLVGFRAYGPALQARGERGFGYDLFTKRGTAAPVLEDMYAKELDADSWKQVNELRKTDPKAADELVRTFSYHIDHGYGMDCYAVGPTLGAGTSALLANDSIVYPYCYKDYQILDNGPLRFTVKLVYNPLTVKGNNNVIENRIISLDAGSQMNKFTITYDNLTEATPVVTGIVLHEPSKDYQADTAKGYIAYADPADPVNGQIYVAAVFPEKVNEAKAITFSDKEKAERGADGHVLAYSTYTPGCSYTYYSGAGWSKWGFENSSKWFDYVQKFAQNLKEPLTVTIK